VATNSVFAGTTVKVPLFVSFGGVGVIGLVPTVLIQRETDGKYWNGGAWQAGVIQLTMTPKDAVNMIGVYQYSFLFPIVDPSYELYHFYYTVPPGLKANDYDLFIADNNFARLSWIAIGTLLSGAGVGGSGGIRLSDDPMLEGEDYVFSAYTGGVVADKSPTFKLYIGNTNTLIHDTIMDERVNEPGAYMFTFPIDDQFVPGTLYFAVVTAKINTVTTSAAVVLRYQNNQKLDYIYQNRTRSL